MINIKEAKKLLHIKEDDMDRTSNMYGRDEKCVKNVCR
jgi:hypothetical protein